MSSGLNRLGTGSDDRLDESSAGGDDAVEVLEGALLREAASAASSDVATELALSQENLQRIEKVNYKLNLKKKAKTNT